ncbi:hypothetical protein C8R43DRAFT_950211 [Mycena crocata]|nr:hypothetical protein C8R43DRAFT_950211 [Mycena crocata]
MSSINEASLALLLSAISAPTATTGSTTNLITVGLLVLALVATLLVRYASPAQLTLRVLIPALADTENAYFGALEAGVISASNSHAEMAGRLSAIQLVASTLREAALRDSLSHALDVRFLLPSRTLAILRCIRQVRRLRIEIEILDECQLRGSSNFGGNLASHGQPRGLVSTPV